MAKKITSRPGLFGDVTHYDENGRKIGKDVPGLYGGTIHYNAHGEKIAMSYPGLLGGTITYDACGRRIGSSEAGFLGSISHYDACGKRIGRSYRGIFGDIFTLLDDLSPQTTPAIHSASFGLLMPFFRWMRSISSRMMLPKERSSSSRLSAAATD